MKEQAQRNSEEEFGDDGDMTVDSVDSLASFDSKDSSLSLDSFESSASMSTTASYLSQASLGSVVDAMVGETIRVARYVYKPVVDCDIDFYSPTILIEDLDESKCIHDFRFRKPELNDR